MQTLLKFIFLFLPSLGFAQVKSEPPEFETQGEQEAYWAKELFENSYVKQKYPLFKGTITVKDDKHFAFNGQVLIVASNVAELKSIFSNGIFYPQIITGDCVKQKPDSLTSQNEVSPLFSCDSLTITEIEELPFPNTSITQKRFRFLLWRKGLANPQLQIMELTNSKAKVNMTLSDFIKGARLTFYKGGSILI
jgi:hypothetical protein